jgi:hypothetical protein
MTVPQSAPKPETAPAAPRPRISTRTFTVGALVVAALVAGVVSLWASTNPDGLEFVATSLGFHHVQHASITAGSPLADYETTGVVVPWLSTAAAGLIGCAATFGLAWLVGRIAKRRRAED